MALIWKYVRQHRKLLLLALFLGTVNQVFSLLDPQIFRLIIDNYARHAGEMPAAQFIRGVLLLTAAFVGVALVSRVAKNFQDYFVNVVVQRTGTRLYAEGVGHSFLLPYAVFEDQRSGELLRKLEKARADIQGLISGAINIVFLSLIGIIFVVAYAFTVHWLVAAVYLAIIPLIGLPILFLSRRIRDAQKNVVRESADLAGSTTETLRNVELVKALGLEEQEVVRLNAMNEKILDLELQKIKFIRILSFIQGTLINAVRAAILFLMLWLISRGSVTLGEFFSLYFYSFFIFNPLGELATVVTQFQEARASGENLEDILKMEPEAVPAEPRDPGQLRSLRFAAVTFKYATREMPALSDISLTMGAGETVAFVGPSGSGKTTLIKLIAGLYPPTEGSLLVNDLDARQIDYRNFRRRIGMVAQETQLFAGTIRENLLFVNPGATDADCLAVLDQAAASSILERADKGLGSKIGEGGIKLSGGERQRLAIARALLREPELLIFDEATSSLDSLTEREIAETVHRIAKAKPHLLTILVAHRLSTVQHADRIYVLEKGRMTEEGTHKELLSEGGLYAAMWREQAGEGGRI